jgi:hypothetical protein
VFCEGVQHRLRFCLNHLNCVKMAVFQFYFQLGKQRKVESVGDGSYVAFSQKFPGEKRIVRLCVLMMQQPVLLSLSHIFMQSW